MDIATILSIIALVVKYGAPYVSEAIVALGKDNITADDIKGLESLIKPPDQY